MIIKFSHLYLTLEYLLFNVFLHSDRRIKISLKLFTILCFPHFSCNVNKYFLWLGIILWLFYIHFLHYPYISYVGINECNLLILDVCKFVLIEKENLCLYGLPNETWEVNLPVEEVPPELPEPALGINFARDGMQEKDWLSLVAVHSDSWLLAVAFYFGARFGFGKSER